MKRLFTSESVTEGHPDKVCDQISDAILDECLRQDENSRVAIETLVKNDLVVIGGELITKAIIESESIVVQVLKENFPLTPAKMIKYFNLKQSIFKKTATYGHFGNKNFSWGTNN